MAGQSNAAPVIIKRKKVVKGDGHHGGAWKVAYADFVTAMMAFFMLMWLLNATTEKQRKGIADYFNPTIPVNRISGGGDDAFGGESIFTEETLSQTGTGATDHYPADTDHSRGETGTTPAPGAEAAQKEAGFIEVEKALAARGGESMTMEALLRHVVTRVTDEGLVIDIFDAPGLPLFRDDTAEPTALARQIGALLADVLALAENRLAVEGHVHSYPVTLRDNPGWDLSAARAQSFRALMEAEGMDDGRTARITGHADRKPAVADPTAIRNNRIEVILLRDDL